MHIKKEKYYKMNKNKKGFFLVLLLLIIATIFVMTDKNTTLFAKDSEFSVRDTASIVKIYMADKNNKQVLFERKANGWVLNDSLKAHKLNVQMLLKTIKDLRVKYPVPQKAHNSIVKMMSGSSVKVEIYKNDYYINLGSIHLFPYVKKERVFYVGDATQDNMGTYMLIEGEERPYVITIPGFRGFVAARFTTNPEDWMSHAIYRIAYNNIQQVSVERPSSPEKSFQIRKLTEGYEIMALQNRQILPIYDTVALYTFLDGFKNINYESLLSGLPQQKIDSLLTCEPVHIIKITETNGHSSELKTYKMLAGQNQEALYGFEPEYDLDRIYAWYEGRMLLVQYFTFDKITRPIDYFYPHQQSQK